MPVIGADRVCAPANYLDLPCLATAVAELRKAAVAAAVAAAARCLDPAYLPAGAAAGHRAAARAVFRFAVAGQVAAVRSELAPGLPGVDRRAVGWWPRAVDCPAAGLARPGEVAA